MIYSLARPFIFALDPETAHRLSIAALATGFRLPGIAPSPPSLRRRLLGLDFPNPLGLAAGYDKNGEVVDGALALGFGFVEVGTVTPKPQPGNPRPRVFRLVEDGGLINRLGFNNEGHEAVHARLRRRGRNGIVGVNIGANRESEDRIADYVAGVRRFADVADYLTINISSPNTPGLRDLQEKEAVTQLLGRVVEAREAQARRIPLLLKIAPDLDEVALAEVVQAAKAAGIEGIVISNTTTSRERLRDTKNAAEAGGLSGTPLLARSTEMLKTVRAMTGGAMTLIGVGGISSPGTAQEKLDAGADLIQLYTGMVYEGPTLPSRIVARLAASQP